MVIFGGIQFRNEKSGDLIDIIHYIRHNTEFKLINTIIWRYKNGMSAHRYFANRHEEVIWLVKSDDYYFDLDSIREPYAEKDLAAALRDKRLNPENTMKGKNPTNVLKLMQELGQCTSYEPVDTVERFFAELEGENAHERNAAI